MSSNDSELVYSTDPEENKRCKRCKKNISSCECKKDSVPDDLSKIKPVLRLERKGRKGKDVTVVDRLPASTMFLKELSQKLKKKCGSGGTFHITENRGSVEIQGDKRDSVKNELIKMGMNIRG
ncbi:hypothetical protein QA601_15585 [Chitinispirillales bacterium ANBcel5]|uniref:hypothetical protein n=1 Tax=Cellulosispirillum alkaliphilum TaxID=3039283 RepID=UPI002A544DA5|nr:hypothetical protein [Chitinispirillales bacterium ANBcel5]